MSFWMKWTRPDDNYNWQRTQNRMVMIMGHLWCYFIVWKYHIFREAWKSHRRARTKLTGLLIRKCFFVSEQIQPRPRNLFTNGGYERWRRRCPMTTGTDNALSVHMNVSWRFPWFLFDFLDPIIHVARINIVSGDPKVKIYAENQWKHMVWIIHLSVSHAK